MTHSDAGHYSAKHAPGATPDRRIAEEIGKRTTGGKLACAEAERIGSELGVSPGEIGRTLDLMELRIASCQLGLFGYAKGKALEPAKAVDPALEGEIRGSLADGRLPCRAAWEMAERLDIARMAVSSACEALGIRIKPCQLGAF